MDFYDKEIETLYNTLRSMINAESDSILYDLAQKADDLKFENTNLKLQK